MKALSVKQPWAELIRLGIKSYEMRTWSTKYRGALLICSSQQRSTTPSAEHWVSVPGPVGVARCVVELLDCRPVKPRLDAAKACCSVERGQFVWEVRVVQQTFPIPVKGKLGLFDVNAKEFTK